MENVTAILTPEVVVAVVYILTLLAAGVGRSIS